MNQTIKTRIEKISNGEVPEGYEKTSFGIFPCDWGKDKKLKQIGQFGKGKGIPGEKMKTSGVPCVGYGDLYMKYSLHFEQAQCFVDEQVAKESQPIKAGTLLFTGTGETAEEIGKCVCYNGLETIYAGGDIITFVPKEINPMFLAYQQNIRFSLVEKSRFGQGHSVVHIQQNELSKLSTAYPTENQEQEKIAEILMKWDEMVEAQEGYIKALELRKKALMQKLLTPKEGWKNFEIGLFIKIKSGYAFKSETYVNNGNYRIITIKNVQQGKIDLSNVSMILEIPENVQRHQILMIDDLVISLTGNVGRSCYITKENCLLNQRVGKIEVSCKLKKYVYALLQTSKFLFTMQNIAQGCAQANLSNDDIENFVVSFPFKNKELNFDEIDMISDTLSAADEEIELQKQKLVEIKQQRKSLQQLLLTGIVRVNYV